ncbi:MAG: transposase family protein [Candidatus Cloacimonetes bacterium]|nr:transposase family protein [Candidatus Cloacimonadota bacterium]MDY0367553.1 transposase family protein [Candidatus Syntrophosphaera sp.]
MAGYRDHRTSAAGAVMAEVMCDDPAPEVTEVVKPAPGRVVEYVPYHKLDEAQLYALLMQEIERRLRSASSRGACWEEITGAYNAGDLVPELRKLRGCRSERGLRHWWQRWSETGDMFELVHKNTAQIRGRKVTQFEQDYLLKHLLSDSKASIGSSITMLKDEARELGLDSPSSEATLKRWCNDWAAAHPAVWAQGRLGDKYVKDNIIKSLIRNTDDIKFGDVLVGDGHVIGNDIINPLTGKPARLTMIMFYDWASRYPVGASLAYTEDSVHILTALRNAILQLEFVPKCVYLDNGRAFKSKLFTQAPEDHDLSVELAGILPRLGIYAHFAEAYNGRSKVIERYFKTMQEQWERFMSGFRGSTIADKPAHLMRNEKWAKKMFEGKPMEYDEALTMAYYWVRYMYGNRPNAQLKGQTPYTVFRESERPADRAVQIRELDILMLKAERKRVRKDGIMLMGNRYWAPELVDHALQPVVIRYDYCDLRQIMVYDERSWLICEAELREGVNGMAFLSDNPLAYHEVKAEIKENKAIHRMIQKTTKRTVDRAKDGVDRELAKHQGIIEQRKAEIEQHNPLFKNPPMMPPRKPRADVHDDVAALEKIAREAESEVPVVIELEQAVAAAAPAIEKTIELEDLLEDEGSLASTVSFKEMQKIIGIER